MEYQIAINKTGAKGESGAKEEEKTTPNICNERLVTLHPNTWDSKFPLYLCFFSFVIAMDKVDKFLKPYHQTHTHTHFVHLSYVSYGTCTEDGLSKEYLGLRIMNRQKFWFKNPNYIYFLFYISYLTKRI